CGGRFIRLNVLSDLSCVGFYFPAIICKPNRNEACPEFFRMLEIPCSEDVTAAGQTFEHFL
ncbi:hypothetical protein CEXT_532411, partial [Caerostris extrusa]